MDSYPKRLEFTAKVGAQGSGEGAERIWERERKEMPGHLLPFSPVSSPILKIHSIILPIKTLRVMLADIKLSET